MILCTVKTKTPKSYVDEAGPLADLRVQFFKLMVLEQPAEVIWL